MNKPAEARQKQGKKERRAAATPLAGLEPLLTIDEAAEILHSSPKTVRRRIKSSELPVIRDGPLIRIRPDDLRSYIAKRRIG